MNKSHEEQSEAEMYESETEQSDDITTLENIAVGVKRESSAPLRDHGKEREAKVKVRKKVPDPLAIETNTEPSLWSFSASGENC